nr:MAG TPA: hypothetical protein [Caudoviricetes sp.]
MIYNKKYYIIYIESKGRTSFREKRFICNKLKIIV